MCKFQNNTLDDATIGSPCKLQNKTLDDATIGGPCKLQNNTLDDATVSGPCKLQNNTLDDATVDGRLRVISPLKKQSERTGQQRPQWTLFPTNFGTSRYAVLCGTSSEQSKQLNCSVPNPHRHVTQRYSLANNVTRL